MAEGGETKDPTNLETDFFRNYGGDHSSYPNTGYLTVDGLPAYGGILEHSVSGSRQYAIDIVHNGHTIIIWDMNYDAHQQETKCLISSFHFSLEKYPR